VRVNLWPILVVVVTLIGFLFGYIISAGTGVEPGYFETAEAGAYGVVKDKGAGAKISEKYQKYYRELRQM
jgi:hypothetical protein